MKDDGKVREFGSGATRSSQAGRIDPEGFLSPLAIERYCQYLLKHQVQADGTVRESDNWQKGMPLVTYMKGMWRHFLHAWQRHRGYEPMDDKAAADIQEDLCAIIFNAQGYLHELLKVERTEIEVDEPSLFYRPDQVILVNDPAGQVASVKKETIFEARCQCCGMVGVTVANCPHCIPCQKN